ncbi:chorismate-binding protein [Candidatus Carsonella ruddii]|uniref:Anthranilate/para-aminobenzoate synthases component I n=1 Tax=Candidatus Carsonella ruddii CE isolate Thao2000 TaxID=1202536 RepID=J7GS20_CARRU|nr:chorismate-binding protein [Candidatus Carsonella ruddii]AFP83517.1 Anthranilate/para-aminobenzoate synthases component I [Candidatus Carsonella ruddii CE isolate Thao2000]
MINHIKNILIFKKNYLNTNINIFFNKNFFFLKNKNTLFFNNFKNYIFNYNNVYFSKKKYNFITSNFLKFLNKKKINIKNKYRFFNFFFGYINFNFFRKKNNIKYNNKDYESFIFFPKIIYFLKKKYHQIFFYFFKKKSFKNISKLINILIFKLKNNYFYYKLNKVNKKNFFIKKKKFFKNCCKIKNNINNGNIIQCIISNNLITKNYIKNFLNISNYNFFIYYKKEIINGNSPEYLIRYEKNKFYSKPIAGTNSCYIKNILENKKELSEHTMLLDLSLNDSFKNNLKYIYLNRIYSLEHHKNIIHIISELYFVTYKKNLFLIIENLFPAGTLSGSPKYVSIKYINKLEKKNRNFYGGNLFLINKNNIETCILIRFIYLKNNNLFCQSGAGIIFSSFILLEWLETIIKKQFFLK